MNLCADGHDEICYESRICPFCIEIESRKSLEAELENKTIEIEELNDKIKEIRAETYGLENHVDRLESREE